MSLLGETEMSMRIAALILSICAFALGAAAIYSVAHAQDASCPPYDEVMAYKQAHPEFKKMGDKARDKFLEFFNAIDPPTDLHDIEVFYQDEVSQTHDVLVVGVTILAPSITPHTFVSTVTRATRVERS
jgi:hypothetical protein